MEPTEVTRFLIHVAISNYLEEKSLKYLLEITKSQVAATDEDQTP